MLVIIEQLGSLELQLESVALMNKHTLDQLIAFIFLTTWNFLCLMLVTLVQNCCHLLLLSLHKSKITVLVIILTVTTVSCCGFGMCLIIQES
jgi:hypothetical protein